MRSTAFVVQLNCMAYHHTVRRYIAKIQKGQEVNLQADYKSRVVFSQEQEVLFCDYLIRGSQMGFGLGSVECQKLAFELGSKNNLNMPAS